jgi:hypothetical protein
MEDAERRQKQAVLDKILYEVNVITLKAKANIEMYVLACKQGDKEEMERLRESSLELQGVLLDKLALQVQLFRELGLNISI